MQKIKIDQHIKKEAQLIIETLHCFKKQVEKGHQLAGLIREFQCHNFTLKEGEIWKIKGENYTVLHSIFEVNFILKKQSEQAEMECVFLSELLPLDYTDFKGVLLEKKNRSFPIVKPLKK